MTAVPDGGGVLPVDKPAGPTSHDIVARARKALGTKKIGHTGTLDPFATGLLLLCVGPATRLSEYLTGMDKEYVATARLGMRTDTDDLEGNPLEEREGWETLTREDLAEALTEFTGTLSQRPPDFSAKKIGGEAAHRIARRGETPELVPVEVTVHELELLDWTPPHVDFHVRCTTGTYVRALARDLGESLGYGAHLTALRRTRIGTVDVAGAVPGDDLTIERSRDAWIGPADALEGLARVEAGDTDARRLATGQGIPAPRDLAEGDGPVAIVRDGALIAIATRREDTLRPRKVFIQP